MLNSLYSTRGSVACMLSAIKAGGADGNVHARVALMCVREWRIASILAVIDVSVRHD
jgi:hypothetical protein